VHSIAIKIQITTVVHGFHTNFFYKIFIIFKINKMQNDIMTAMIISNLDFFANSQFLIRMLLF